MFGIRNPRLRIIWISVISFIFGALSVVLFSKFTVAIVSNAISEPPFVTMNQINLSLKSDLQCTVNEIVVAAERETFFEKHSIEDVKLLNFLEDESHSWSEEKYGIPRGSVESYWYVDRNGNQRVMGSFTGCQYSSGAAVDCTRSVSRLNATAWQYHAEAVSLPWVKTVCEVGFSGGQSANFYLATNPSVRYIGFDLFNYGYMWAGYRFLQKQYGSSRISIVPGFTPGSVVDGLKAARAYQDCDVISIDGPHTETLTIENFKMFESHGISKRGNIFLFDGCDRKAVQKVWKKLRMEKRLCGKFSGIVGGFNGADRAGICLGSVIQKM